MTDRLVYRGVSRDISYSPWLRLVHGMHYDVNKSRMRNGKIKATISDSIESVKVVYENDRAFDKEWC